MREQIRALLGMTGYILVGAAIVLTLGIESGHPLTLCSIPCAVMAMIIILTYHFPGASRITRWGGGFLAGVMIVGIVIAIMVDSAKKGPESQEAPPTASAVDHSSRARAAARTLVSDNLRAPASATFRDCRIIAEKHPRYVVHVTVDSENGFGAMLRGDFLCCVRLKEGDVFSAIPSVGIQETSSAPEAQEIELFKTLNSW